MVYAITSKKIFNGENFHDNKAIIIEGNRIKNILPRQEIGNIEIIDYGNNIIAPAFVDLQINGCGGVLFNDDISTKTLEIMLKTNLSVGTTSFLPTLITAAEADVKSAVEVATQMHEKYPFNIVGVHIEGPYISKIKKGIHNPVYMKPISPQMVDFFIESNKKIPILLTLAPEENDVALIQALAVAGVKVALGHSNANYAQAATGIDAGISMATHLFNAMSPLEGRNPNVVGAVLNSPYVSTGVIIDGNHVDFANVALAHKIKADKLFMVTDAATPMGTDMKEFVFADQKVYVQGNKYVNKDGTLAGANITMLESVGNAVNHVNLSLAESLKMASLYPVRAFGVKKIGRVLADYVANLIVFDDNYKLIATIDGGNIIKGVK
ncbi:MAG: N-acetylglucosamine-6-phosphate deacetylase [Alphaproteobacteria bacterium]|jgi:N-acetylglucosamine-6-phosphate deacetylase|nr:N-acetylglucosamine-6-phosphate deacetylase [Alphaproteobacteria bacterium]